MSLTPLSRREWSPSLTKRRSDYRSSSPEDAAPCRSTRRAAEGDLESPEGIKHAPPIHRYGLLGSVRPVGRRAYRGSSSGTVVLCIPGTAGSRGEARVQRPDLVDVGREPFG